MPACDKPCTEHVRGCGAVTDDLEFCVYGYALQKEASCRLV